MGKRKRKGKGHIPLGFTPNPPAIEGIRHLLRQGLILPRPDGRQGPATGHPRRLAIEVHCKGNLAGQALAARQSRPPIPRGELRQPLPPASAWRTGLLQLLPHSGWSLMNTQCGPVPLLCPPRGRAAPYPCCSPWTDVPEKAIGRPGELGHATGRMFPFLPKMYFHCTINMTTN